MTKLKEAHVSYIAELVQLSADDLKNISLGDDSINEIQAKLAEFNLSLGISLDDWPPDELCH